MSQFNPNDFYPASGKEINSQGNVVTPADGVNPDGSQNVVTIGRNTNYQRVLANQALSPSAGISFVLNCGLGSKSFNIAFKTSGIANMQVYPCDANGNMLGALLLYQTSSTGYTNGGINITDWGGAPYIGIYVFDKSAAANTITFVDVWWTKG